MCALLGPLSSSVSIPFGSVEAGLLGTRARRALNSARFVLMCDFFLGGAGDEVGEGEGLCVGPDVPCGFSLCYAGMLRVSLLWTMWASSVARVVATGWCARGAFGLLRAGGCLHNLWSIPLRKTAFHDGVLVPVADAAV